MQRHSADTSELRMSSDSIPPDGSKRLSRKLAELDQLLREGLLDARHHESEKQKLLDVWRSEQARETLSDSPPGGSEEAANPFNLSRLPSIVALPLREYLDERHPVLKLWHACDAVELLLRLLVMLGLSDCRRSGGDLPAALLSALRSRIEQPTLGKWRAMAAAVAENVVADTSAVPELPGLVKDVLVPLLDGPPGTVPTAYSSLSQLRNVLAHGGGVTRGQGAELLKRWESAIVDVVQQLAWLGEIDLVVRHGPGVGVLRGPTVGPLPYAAADPPALDQAFEVGNEVVAVRMPAVLPLWPLNLYCPPRSPDPNRPSGSEPVPQVYVRRGDVRLQFTPLGSDEICQSDGDETAMQAFRALFHLDERESTTARPRFVVRDFESEIRRDAERLVGRTYEIGALHAALRAAPQGVLWVWGVAGIGKSYLIARIVGDLLDDVTPGRLLLPYRFKAGDERCSRDRFLRYATERLGASALLQPAAAPEKETHDPGPLEQLRMLLRRLGRHRVLFVLDGLDEIAARDPLFVADVPLGVREPGVTWLCSGRPERDLSEALARADCVVPFPDGVPPMSSGDIRTMLLEKIGPLRRRLLRGDGEDQGRVINPFVERVSRAAAGLPLYVTYVVGDVLNGHFRALDAGEQLPPSLEAYHEELLRRCAIGTLGQVTTPIAATLAAAKEPMSLAMLFLLLRRRMLVPDGERGRALVRQGLSAIASMVGSAPTPEGEAGYALYHDSLRSKMLTGDTTCGAVELALETLQQAALTVDSSSSGAPYLYRHAVAHLLEGGRHDDAVGLLTDFSWLMGRLRTLGDPAGVIGLGEDWRSCDRVNAVSGDTRIWADFFRQHEHILSRGNAHWPAYKILLQLAAEHADDSPITRAAEGWIADGRCDWGWLKQAKRPPRVVPSSCLRIFEGHGDSICGLAQMPGERVVSWSYDGTLRLWSLRNGRTTAVLKGHTKSVLGARLLADGRLLSWSQDGTLRIWNPDSSTCVRVLAGHSSDNLHADVMADGRLFSWTKGDGLGCVWSPDADQPLVSIQADARAWWLVAGADRVISSTATEARIWSASTGECVARCGHDDVIEGLGMLPGERLFSWSSDGSLRLWDALSGDCIAVVKGPPDKVESGYTTGEDGTVETTLSFDKIRKKATLSRQMPTRSGNALVLSGDRVVTHSLNASTLAVWDLARYRRSATLTGHRKRVAHITQISGNLILSCGDDGDLRLWNVEGGTCVTTFEDRSSRIGGATVLPDGKILSWSRSLRIWDPASGGCAGEFPGHADMISGAMVLDDSRLVSWSTGERSFRLWNIHQVPETSGDERHAFEVAEVLHLPNRRFVSFCTDRERDAAKYITLMPDIGEFELSLSDSERRHAEKLLRIWDADTGECVAVLDDETSWVEGALVLDDGRIVSWHFDGELRLWDSESGCCTARFGRHAGRVAGGSVLPDGRMLSWSKDGTIRIWDLARRECLAILEGHFRLVRGVEPLRSRRLLSWSDDRTIRIWNLSAGDRRGRRTQRLRALRVLSATYPGTRHTVSVMDVEVLSDGRVLSWHWDHALRLWDPGLGRCLRTMRGHEKQISAVDVLESAGGVDDRMLSSSEDGTTRLWDLDSGHCLAVLAAVDGWRTLSEDRLLVWSADGTPTLVDTRTGQPLAAMDRSAERVGSATVLPSGDTLLWSGGSSENARVSLWDDQVRELKIAVAYRDAPYVRPDLLAGLEPDRSDALARGDCFAWERQDACGISVSHVAGLHAVWHAAAEMTAHYLLADGTLVASVSDGRVCFLKLFRGGRRVTLEEMPAG
jgi:WD40 repeat protein